MQPKQRLFIYDRKEMGVLLLLALLVAIFAFTLGVHLGKRVGVATVDAGPSPLPVAATTEDQVPSGQDLTDQAKAAAAEAEQAIDQAAHDEVEHTGLKVDRPKQVDLPKELKSQETQIQHDSADQALESLAAFTRSAPAGKYALQIGSHPRLEAAKEQLSSAEAAGLNPLLRVVEIKDRGRWYRVFVGGYSSRELAEKSGKELQSRGLIESYIVANAVK